MNWEIGIDIYTLLILCIKYITVENILHVCSFAQSRPTLCGPIDSSLSGSSSVPGISQQEYWSGLPLLTSGDLPDPGTEPASLVSPALAGR